jgi:hypothetical protein
MDYLFITARSETGAELLYLVKPETKIEFNWQGRQHVLFVNTDDVVVRLAPADVTSIGITTK